MSGDYLGVVGQGEAIALVETCSIDNPEVSRAIGILGSRPPFNGDPRIDDLDFDTYMIAKRHALEASAIMSALEPIFEQGEDIFSIVVGGRGAVALKTTSTLVGTEENRLHDLLAERSFREQLEAQVGHHPTPITRPVNIGF